MPLIDAYRRDNGRKVRVPEHWFDHPTLGRPFSKTPSQRARDQKKPRATAARTNTPAHGDREEGVTPYAQDAR